MKRFFSIIFGVLLARVGLAQQLPAPHYQGLYCELQNLIGSLESDVSTRNQMLKTYMADKQVVYVGGFLAEDGFVVNSQAISRIHGSIPVKSIYPPSKVAIEKNVAFLLGALRNIQSKNPSRKIILIGHSKGGAEVVQLAGTHPEIFAANNELGFQVEMIVPIHATIGGTILADLELAEDPSQLARWFDYVNRKKIRGLGWLEWLKGWFLDSSSEGFRSLTHKASQERSAHLVANQGTNAALLSERVLFVSSSIQSSKSLPFYLKTLADFMFDQGYVHDGLLLEKDQIADGFGTHLLSLNGADHLSLTTNSGDPKCRQQFTQALLLMLALRPVQQ